MRNIGRVIGLATAVLAGVLLGIDHAHADPAPTGYAPAIMPTVAPAPVEDITRTPILLVADQGIDPRWDIAAAAYAWNDALGCQVFQTYVDTDWHETWRVVEVEDLMAPEGYETPGLADPATMTISLNPEFIDVPGVTIHETGHLVYGMGHHDSTVGVMSGHFDADRTAITDTEAAQARSLQTSRCN